MMNAILSTSEKCSAIEKHINENIPLAAQGACPASHYVLEKKSAYALIAALTSGRPLLVQGEPGIGKSELARAAAYLLDSPLLSSVVQPDSTYQELLWDMDYTKRLADAQLAAIEGSSAKVTDTKNYIAPGVLWYAINWASAEQQAKRCSSNFQPASDISADNVKTAGCVLLIDEVDKSDISFANGLLEVLANQQFSVPPLGNPVTLATMSPPPFILLTSNNTRQLPAAFLRRWVVLTLRMPTEGKEAEEYLIARGRAHYTTVPEEILLRAAQRILHDRARCEESSKTGVAEYLDLLHALDALGGDSALKVEWLDKLQEFFYKSPDA